MTIIEYTGGENPIAIAWLDKLPKLNADASREAQVQWIETLCSIREAFPDRMRQVIPLGLGEEVIISWPKGFTADGIAGVVELLTLMQKQWERREA